MSYEFIEAHDKLISDSQDILFKSLYLKLKVMKHCHDACLKLKEKNIPEIEQMEFRQRNFDFKCFTLDEIRQLKGTEDL